MVHRLDVRRVLLAHWHEELKLLLRKGDLNRGSPTEYRDPSWSSADGGWQIEFPGDGLTRVIVVACEAAGQPGPPRRSGASATRGRRGDRRRAAPR
jgi:hypothetical protein